MVEGELTGALRSKVTEKENVLPCPSSDSTLKQFQWERNANKQITNNDNNKTNNNNDHNNNDNKTTTIIATIMIIIIVAVTIITTIVNKCK